MWKEQSTVPPPKNYKNLSMFCSWCHFILLKWKVVFTGIKFSFPPQNENFCKNYKFPQQHLHKNVWSYPSGCLLTCLKWKAVCNHGWKYTHQEKLIMQIFSKWEQWWCGAPQCAGHTTQKEMLGEDSTGQLSWTRPASKPHLRHWRCYQNVPDVLPKEWSFDSHMAKYFQK